MVGGLAKRKYIPRPGLSRGNSVIHELVSDVGYETCNYPSIFNRLQLHREHLLSKKYVASLSNLMGSILRLKWGRELQHLQRIARVTCNMTKSKDLMNIVCNMTVAPFNLTVLTPPPSVEQELKHTAQHTLCYTLILTNIYTQSVRILHINTNTQRHRQEQKHTYTDNDTEKDTWKQTD